MYSAVEWENEQFPDLHLFSSLLLVGLFSAKLSLILIPNFKVEFYSAFWFKIAQKLPKKCYLSEKLLEVALWQKSCSKS